MGDYNRDMALIDTLVQGGGGGGGGGGPVSTPHTIWVNWAYTGAEQNGKLGSPFTTIQAAIDSVPDFEFEYYFIRVAPTSIAGSAGESVTIRDKIGIAIVSDEGPIGGASIMVDSINIEGFVYSVIISGFVVYSPVNINSTVEGCTVGFANSNVDLNINNEYIRLSAMNCSINRGERMPPSPGDYNFENCYGTLTLDGGYLTLNNCLGFSVDHRSGSVTVNNSTLTSLVSSAIGDIYSSVLALYSGSLSGDEYVISHKLGPLVKTGDCPYIMGTFAYDVSHPDTVLNGDRIDRGGIDSGSVVDINERAGYTNIGNTLEDHLNAISETMSELFTSVSDGKSALVTDIKYMGGIVTPVWDIPTFGELSKGIRSIPSEGEKIDISKSVVVNISTALEGGPPKLFDNTIPINIAVNPFVSTLVSQV